MIDILCQDLLRRSCQSPLKDPAMWPKGFILEINLSRCLSESFMRWCVRCQRSWEGLLKSSLRDILCHPLHILSTLCRLCFHAYFKFFIVVWCLSTCSKPLWPTPTSLASVIFTHSKFLHRSAESLSKQGFMQMNVCAHQLWNSIRIVLAQEDKTHMLLASSCTSKICTKTVFDTSQFSHR